MVSGMDLGMAYDKCLILSFVLPGVSGAQSFHFNVLKPVNLDAFDPYDSKTCMAIGAHEGNDYIPAYDIESLGWMMYLLFSFQDQSNSKSDTPRNNLLLFKKQILVSL